ncbi:MAG: sulfate adenylyltransferase, partial [Lentisphaerae bacterium]|nr:sulfate adenylyltransferase [Lentisphaerota bacterium]
MIETKDKGNLVPPHGGKLIPLLVEDAELAAAREEAASMPVVRMTSRETSDLIMMATGAFSPLRGFMGQDDYLGVVNDMHMKDGTLWPIPITLAVDGGADVKKGEPVALVDDESGELMGSMVVEEKYSYDKKLEAGSVFGTEDEEHPGVAKVYAQGDTLIAGPVKAYGELDYPERFAGYNARPAETRAIFKERGWQTVAAFQT